MLPAGCSSSGSALKQNREHADVVLGQSDQQTWHHCLSRGSHVKEGEALTWQVKGEGASYWHQQEQLHRPSCPQNCVKSMPKLL